MERDSSMTDIRAASSTRLARVFGGLLILFSFVVLDPPTEATTIQPEPSPFPALRMLASCVAGVCLAQAHAWRLATEMAYNGGRIALGLADATNMRPGLLNSFLDGLFSFNCSERVSKQLGGPLLLTHGMFPPGWAAPPSHSLNPT